MPIRAPRFVALTLTAALALSSCGDDDDGGAVAPSESTTTTEDPTTTTTAADTGGPTTTTAPTVEPGTNPEEAPVVILVELDADGRPEGGPREVEVFNGQQVTLRVVGDVTDEIHLHGYDLYADLAPGEPAELVFTADIPGQFEVELHGDGTLLAELTVQ